MIPSQRTTDSAAASQSSRVMGGQMSGGSIFYHWLQAPLGQQLSPGM